MAISVHFSPQGMDKAKYDEVIRRLQAAGAGAPRGRLHHCCYDSGDRGLRVMDVFDSQENFQAFGGTLIPILSALGIDAGQPSVGEVHNIIRGG